MQLFCFTYFYSNQLMERVRAVGEEGVHVICSNNLDGSLTRQFVSLLYVFTIIRMYSFSRVQFFMHNWGLSFCSRNWKLEIVEFRNMIFFVPIIFLFLGTQERSMYLQQRRGGNN